MRRMSRLEDLRPNVSFRGLLPDALGDGRGAAEALSYNGLVQSWPEITPLASDGRDATWQEELF